MPKLAANKVPSYRHHKQSGQAIVTLSGRDHVLGPYGSKASRLEYDRLIAEWVASGRQLHTPAGGALTVAMLIDRFRQHAETYYRNPDGSPSREQINFRQALRPLLRLYGDIRATDSGWPSRRCMAR